MTNKISNTVKYIFFYYLIRQKLHEKIYQYDEKINKIELKIVTGFFVLILKFSG
jgi:hypothetical protein